MDTELTAIQRACAATNGQANLARLVGVTPAAVNQWFNGSRPVPLERCLSIEQATDGKVTRADLRPDDYWLIWPDLHAPAAEAKAA